jgi:hypothetical protein
LSSQFGQEPEGFAGPLQRFSIAAQRLLYDEELKGITHENTFHLSENSYHCNIMYLSDFEQHPLSHVARERRCGNP